MLAGNSPAGQIWLLAVCSWLSALAQNYGNKKRRGSKVSLRAYPNNQAFALPLEKDKQRKACPRQVIYTTIPTTTRLNSPMIIYIRKDTTPKVGVTPYYI